MIPYFNLNDNTKESCIYVKVKDFVMSSYFQAKCSQQKKFSFFTQIFSPFPMVSARSAF